MKFRSGQSLVELLLAISLAALLLPALLTGLVASREGRVQQKQRSDAVSYLRESAEAVRNVRDSGWSNFATNGTFHPVISGSNWSLVSGAETLNGFTRQIVVSDVSRDASGAIVTSGGTVDPSTKKVVSTVSWTQPYASNISSTTYITRHENISVIQTTQAHFDGAGSNLSVKTNTFTANSAGGEVILGAGGGGGDWCIPAKSITEYDLPKSGVANAITAIEGRVFAGTGENSSGVSFADVQTTTNVDPPQILNSKTFDGYKTNTVFGESNFAYLGTDNNSKEVVMLNLNQYSDPPTNSKYQEVGAINVSGNSNGDSIYVVNDKAYITAGNKLYIYTLNSTRTTATVQNSSGYTLSGTGKKILIGSSGQYAYVITSATSNQFEIIDISNASNPTRASIRTVGTSQAGVDLYVTSSEATVYVALAYSAGRNNIYKIDTTNKSSPSVGSGYSTSGMSPKGINVVTGNRAIIVGTGGTYQYQVINTNTMAMCSATSGLQYATGINGVASVLQANGFAYSYIITGDASSELKIILGGAGGQYVTSGTFESSIYNTNSTTAFNSFSATVAKPSSTDITMQIAVANTADCSASRFTYLGPGGSPSQYFSVGSDPTLIQGAIPITTNNYYTNPGQCVRYKFWLSTTDSSSTPDLYDMTINYSP